MVRDASLAVVIVCFNTREHLAACLATVLPESPRQVVVADNGSADGSIAMVRQQFPSVVVDVPGDSAEPTQAAWKLPPGFVADDLQWPAPSLIRVGPINAEPFSISKVSQMVPKRIAT